MSEVHATVEEMNRKRQLAITPNIEDSGMSHEIM